LAGALELAGGRVKLAAFAGSSRRFAGAVALEPSETHEITRSELLALRVTNPSLDEFLLERLAVQVARPAAPLFEALFEALPPTGVSCLRFNFRGVGASTGEHTGGDAERLEPVAAHAARTLRPGCRGSLLWAHASTSQARSAWRASSTAIPLIIARNEGSVACRA